MLLQQKKPIEALALIDSLLLELKRLDDKQMLTEVHLTECRIYHVLQNVPKAKASLTSSRTAANAIYVVSHDLDECAIFFSPISCCSVCKQSISV